MVSGLVATPQVSRRVRPARARPTGSLVDSMCLERRGRARGGLHLPRACRGARTQATPVVHENREKNTEQKSEDKMTRREAISGLLGSWGVFEDDIVGQVAAFAEAVLVPHEASLGVALVQQEAAVVELVGEVQCPGWLKTRVSGCQVQGLGGNASLTACGVYSDSTGAALLSDLTIRGDNQILKVCGKVTFTRCVFIDTEVEVVECRARGGEVEFVDCQMKAGAGFKRPFCLRVAGGTATLRGTKVVNLVSGAVAQQGRCLVDAATRLFPRADVEL